MRPPHPAPNVRDDRDTPLEWRETAADMEVIWISGEGKYFCKQGWTAQISLIHLNKFGCARKVESGKLVMPGLDPGIHDLAA